jgi:hypothetical protein
MEARVGIELYRLVDSTYVIEFIGRDWIATYVRNARNARLGDVQVTQDFKGNNTREKFEDSGGCWQSAWSALKP